MVAHPVTPDHLSRPISPRKTRILVTATPRSRSTALEQSFRQRKDCAVHHEMCAAPHYYGAESAGAVDSQKTTAERLGDAGAALVEEGAGSTTAGAPGPSGNRAWLCFGIPTQQT